MFGFIKFWKWRIFHLRRKKKEELGKESIPSESVSNQELESICQELKSANEKQEKELDKAKTDDKPTLYPSRNMALITTESDMKLRPIKVNEDHTILYGKKKVMIKPDRQAHILDLSIHDLMPTKKQRFLCRILGIPKYQTFRVFSFQLEGEMTHDPHLDRLTDEMKLRFEKVLMLVGKFAEADAGAVIYEGIKGPKHWWDYIPYIIICLIVAFFLFAFQVQPNL